ncbi:MAG: hypothetical protein KDI48_13855, partial [Xanthomonadales bacterium]|nr:hypothetical protein [Xanthomonadales bacterium]
MVDAFWFVMAPLAWIGYRLCRQGRHLSGSAVLLLYAGCNLLTLGHYRFAPFSHIAPRIHAYILLEA